MTVAQVVATLTAYGFESTWDARGEVFALVTPSHHGGETSWWERVPGDEFGLMGWISYGA